MSVTATPATPVTAPTQPLAPVVEQETTQTQAKDPKLQARIKRALAVQQDFAVAPDVWVSNSSSDEMMELRKRFLPESIPQYDAKGLVIKPPTQHEYFGDPREVDMDADKGYRSIIHPITRDQVKTPGGMLMYSLPQPMHEARVRKAQKESNRLFKESADQMKEQAGRGGAVSADGVVEEVNETKRITEGEFFDE